MDNKISWFDRVMTPKTKAYKDFENEIKNTSPEIFFRDGEREFSNQEKKFMQIYKYRESQVIGSSDFTVTTRFDELFLEPDFKENLVSASHLPKGWCWYDYDDGSGSLKSPNGNNYYSYDLQTQEYKLPTLHNRWTNMKDLFEPPKSLNAFKTYAELDLIEKAAENDLSPKLSEAEKNDLLNYISLNKKIANGEILNIYHNSDSLPAKKILPENDIKFYNQNPKIMETKKEFDQVKYLKDQMKYLGFGEDEKLQKDLEKGISSKKQEFEINTNSNKTLPENKVDFTLKFNKTDRGGIFLNSYHAKMTNDKKEEISHNFPVNKDYTFTAKEAVNLLEGRSVKIEFLNPKNNQIEPAFVQFNFNEPKTDKGNYFFQNFYKNYGVDTAKIVEKSNLVFDNPEWKENSIKSLEKGNIVKVKFKEDDQIREGKAVLDPQNRNLKLYDNGMNRLNTNKPLEGLEQDHKHDKANLREQSIKR